MKNQVGAGDLFAQFVKQAKAPTTVTFQVTDRCNYDCVHCYQEHTRKTELTFEQIDDILQQLAEAGVLFLTLMGGEFFMRPDADRIVERAHQLGFAIKLLSTGHHIHERRADFLATLKPIQLDLSLYGDTAHVHDQVTRQAGSWKRTVAAARRMIERKVPVLLKSPVMEQNIEGLKNLKALAESMGATCSFDAKVTAKENSDLEPTTLRMGQATLKTFYRSEELGIATQLEETYRNADLKQLRPEDHTACGAGERAIAINPQGQVWPCNALPVECGDLREQTFQEIWKSSEKLQHIRTLRWRDIDDCKRCELRAFCQRCHGMALIEHGRIEGPSLEACRHAVAVRDSLRDKGVIPADHLAMPPSWHRVDPNGQIIRKLPVVS